MKSKKLFAILTLVAFMMTLLPMAAFAAASRQTSSVSYSATSVEADNSTRIKVTVNLKDGDYAASAGTVYFAANREATDYKVYFADDETSVKDVIGGAYANTYEFAVDASGEVKFWIQSKIAGTSKFAAGIAVPGVDANGDIYQYLIGTTGYTEYTTKLIPNSLQNLSFVASSVDTVTVTATTWSDAAHLANGTQYAEITFTAKAKGGAPVANETMTFSADKSGVSMNKTEGTTDANGQVKVKVYSTKADTYKIEGKVSDKKGSVNLTFNAGSPADITLMKGGNNELTSKDDAYKFTVKLSDVAGNKFKVTGTGHSATVMKDTYKVDFEVMTKPTDSAIDKANFTGEGDDDSYLKVAIPAAGIKKEGKYVVRALLENGKYVDVAFESKKQGDITGITLSYDVTSLPLGGKTDAPEVKRVDALGVKKTVANDSADLVWSVSDVRKMSSVAAEEINTAKGIVYATSDKDYAGDLIVTVIDKAENKTASYTVKVGVQPVSITVTPANAEVGVSKTLDLVVKDGNGNQVAFGEGYTFAATTYSVTSKPAGSIVTIEDGSKFAANLKETGKASVKVTSNKAGQVAVSMVLKATKDTKDTYFSTSFVVDVKEPAPPKPGAKSVTMFIGAKGFFQDGTAKVMDVAPFIKDSRTFVEVRSLAAAFGATVDWNAATQTVTLTRTDMTITIVIGSSAITQVAGGVTSTITADVPAYITAEGRTVLPFRAVGDAFGAAVAYDAVTQSVSFTQ